MTSVPDILQSLNGAGVRYILIGGYASVVPSAPRTTLDIDLAMEPVDLNVHRALPLKGIHNPNDRRLLTLASG